MGYDLAQEDHIPVLPSLKVDEFPTIVEDIGGKVKLQWNGFDSDEVLRYSDLTDNYLQELVVPEGAKQGCGVVVSLFRLRLRAPDRLRLRLRLRVRCEI